MAVKAGLRVKNLGEGGPEAFFFATLLTMSKSRGNVKRASVLAAVLVVGGCVSDGPVGIDPGPPAQQSPAPGVEAQLGDGNPLNKERLTFEDLTAGLEEGIELSNDPWDPWNDLSATWEELFSPNSRTLPSQPYIARNAEATKFVKSADNGAGTIGLVDPTEFCLDQSSACLGTSDLGGPGRGHGHRMALNAIHVYPEIGVEAVSIDAYFMPLFGEVDGRYQAMSDQLGVDGLTNTILYSVSAFALKESDQAKVVAKATNQRWEFNDTDGLWNGYPFGEALEAENRAVAESQGPAWLAGFDWMARGFEETVVETEYGPWTVNRSSYEWSQWWENNQESLNTLLVSSNNNNYVGESGELVDCFPASGGISDDYDPLCGVTDTVMAVTGLGMDSTLFVAGFNERSQYLNGNHSGPFLEHTIYAYGAQYGDVRSNSMTTPLVAAMAQRVIDTNPSLSAPQVKQVLLRSADLRTGYRVLGDPNSAPIAETVRVANAASAVECARTLRCLK